MRSLLTAAAALTFLAGASAHAAPCKDPKTGKFVKCAEKTPSKATRCKDAKGKFAKCGTPGAKPV